MMKNLTNNSVNFILLFITISLCTSSCSNDDKTSNVVNEGKAIATEVVNNKEANTKDTVSHLAINKTAEASTEVQSELPSEELLSHGEEAHKDHCYKCHTDEVYTREDRFVKSIDALSKQVLRCKDGSNIPWFDEDSDAVVQFLNQKYYRF